MRSWKDTPEGAGRHPERHAGGAWVREEGPLGSGFRV